MVSIYSLKNDNYLGEEPFYFKFSQVVSLPKF